MQEAGVSANTMHKLARKKVANTAICCMFRFISTGFVNFICPWDEFIITTIFWYNELEQLNYLCTTAGWLMNGVNKLCYTLYFCACAAVINHI